MRLKHSKENPMNTKAILCTALLAALSLPSLSADLVGPDITVRYADLDIDVAPGAAQLLKRIEAAAGRVCARLDHGDLASVSHAQQCRRQVTAAAVSKVNHPMLQAAYDAKRGVVTGTVASAGK
jgi:UrcA family protein